MTNFSSVEFQLQTPTNFSSPLFNLVSGFPQTILQKNTKTTSLNTQSKTACMPTHQLSKSKDENVPLTSRLDQKEKEKKKIQSQKLKQNLATASKMLQTTNQLESKGEKNKMFLLSAKGGMVTGEKLTAETLQREHLFEQEEKGEENETQNQNNQIWEIELDWDYKPSREFQKVYDLRILSQHGIDFSEISQLSNSQRKTKRKKKKKKEKEIQLQEEFEAEIQPQAKPSESKLGKNGYIPTLFIPLQTVLAETTEISKLRKVAQHLGIKTTNREFSTLSNEAVVDRIHKTLLAQNRYFDNSKEITDLMGEPILEQYQNKPKTKSKVPLFFQKIEKTTTISPGEIAIADDKKGVKSTDRKYNSLSSYSSSSTSVVFHGKNHQNHQSQHKSLFSIQSENEPPNNPISSSSSSLWFTPYNSLSAGYPSYAPPTIGTSRNVDLFQPKFSDVKNRLQKSVELLFLISPDLQIMGESDPIPLLNLKKSLDDTSYAGQIKTFEKILDMTGDSPENDDDLPTVKADEDSGGIKIPSVFMELISRKKIKNQKFQKERTRELLRFRHMSANQRVEEMFRLVLDSTSENITLLKDLLETTPGNGFDPNRTIPSRYDGENAIMLAISHGNFFHSEQNPVLAILTLLSSYFVFESDSPRPMNLNATDNLGRTALMHVVARCQKMKQEIWSHLRKVEALSEEEREKRDESLEDIQQGSTRAMRMLHFIISILLNPEIAIYNFLKKDYAYQAIRIPLIKIGTMKQSCSKNELTVDVNADTGGVTAGHLAVKYCCYFCFRMIQKYGPGMSLTKAEETTGRTALHDAARNANPLMLHGVLKSEVDHFALDKKNQTAFHHAVRHSWEDWKLYWPALSEVEVWEEINHLLPTFKLTDSLLTLLWNSFKNFAEIFAQIQTDQQRSKAEKKKKASLTSDEEAKFQMEKHRLTREIIRKVVDAINSEGLTILMISSLKRDLKSVEFELDTMYADPTVLSPTTCLKSSTKGCSILFMMTLLNDDLSTKKLNDRNNIIKKLETATRRIENNRSVLRHRLLEEQNPSVKPPSSTSTSMDTKYTTTTHTYTHLIKHSDKLDKLIEYLMNEFQNPTQNKTANPVDPSNKDKFQSKMVDFFHSYWSKSYGCNLKEMTQDEKRSYLAERGRLAMEQGIYNLHQELAKIEEASNYSEEICEELAQFLRSNSLLKPIFERNKPFSDILTTTTQTGEDSDDEDVGFF